MKKSVILGVATIAGLAAGAAAAGTAGRRQGARQTELWCDHRSGWLRQRLMQMANGRALTWRVCRAVAAAVLGDANAVEFVPTTGKTRFTALASGEIDMLARNTTWTFSRDVDLKFEFVGVNYYDGQGFMVPKALGVSSAKELDGATVCIQTGTTTELNLADFFRANNMSYEPVPIETNAEAQQQYLAGACDVYTTDASGLAATRATFENPGDHVHAARNHLERAAGPAGPSRRPRVGRCCPLDPERAGFAAEELGVTSANIEELKWRWHRQPGSEPSAGHRRHSG